MPHINHHPSTMSEAQRALAEAHGTPAEFAQACYAAVPGFVSMDEASAAVRKYCAEWDAAANPLDLEPSLP